MSACELARKPTNNTQHDTSHSRRTHASFYPRALDRVQSLDALCCARRASDRRASGSQTSGSFACRGRQPSDRDRVWMGDRGAQRMDDAAMQ